MSGCDQDKTIVPESILLVKSLVHKKYFKAFICQIDLSIFGALFKFYERIF